MLRAILSRDRENRPTLAAEEIHHLRRVRRLKPDEEFLALSIEEQTWFRCRLENETTSSAVILIEELPSQAESKLSITLGQALIQRERFEWVLQKSVELGVSRIIPVKSQRSEFRLQPAKLERARTRWEKIAREALKQCGGCRLPEITAPMSLESYLENDQAVLRVYLDEEGGASLHSILSTHPDLIGSSVLIGPEGGWDARERKILRQAGLRAAYMGARILRSETAAIAMIALLQYELGDLGGRV